MRDVTLVILGASGDLAVSKLLPACGALMCDQEDDTTLNRIIGVARTPSFYEDMCQALSQRCPVESHEHVRARSLYLSCDFDEPDWAERVLQQVVAGEKNASTPGSRVIYCAVPPALFRPITRACYDAGLVVPGHAGHRIVYEKPFGADADQAREINAVIDQCGYESNVYRVDHYLTKSLVRSLGVMRYANTLLQAAWSHSAVERIEVVADEAATTEGQPYFHAYGTIKDMVQSHVLQLLALAIMREPETLDAAAFAECKAKALASLSVDAACAGQYDGYQEHAGDTQAVTDTPTFAMFRCTSSLEEWQGVPLYARTGKALAEKRTHVKIVCRPPKNCFGTHASCRRNTVCIELYPQERVLLGLNVHKVPTCSVGEPYQDLMPIVMSYCHDCDEEQDSCTAYQALISAVLRGDMTMHITAEEVQAQWEFVAALERQIRGVVTYESGTSGPKEADKVWNTSA